MNEELEKKMEILLNNARKRGYIMQVKQAQDMIANDEGAAAVELLEKVLGIRAYDIDTQSNSSHTFGRD